MKTQTTTAFDQAKSNAFAEKLLAHLNGAALSVMISVAHRTKLFDAMVDLPPSTSNEIAKAVHLNERYVREALGAFVVGSIVEYDSEAQTYHLPAEHAAWLSRRAVPNNLASTMQWVSVMGGVEDEIVTCFKNGGGLTYDQYKRFHEVMADESYQTAVHPILNQIIPLVPGLKEKLDAGIDVMDLGCGSGAVLTRLAEAFPKSRFTGYDLCEEAVIRACRNVRVKRLSNIRFEVRDAAKVEETEKYDFISTFDAIHDQADPSRVLKNIFTALKADGVYLMQDIAGSSYVEQNMNHPIAPFIYTISCMHCMSVSLEQKGDGLGAMWGMERACSMLKEAGFAHVDVKRLNHDIVNNYYIARK